MKHNFASAKTKNLPVMLMCLILLICAALLVEAMLVGCSAQGEISEQGTSAGGQASTQEATEAVPEDVSQDDATSDEQQETTSSEQEGAIMGNNTFIVSVNGSKLTAVIENNSSAEALRDLLEQGPLTIHMEDYASMEKVGPIGSSLPRNDSLTTTQAGDIILYQGNQLVVYYDQNTWSFTRIGKIQGVSAQELRSILGSGDATVMFSLPDAQ